MTLRGALQRRPTLWFFLLVFLVAWGSVLVVVGPGALLAGAIPVQWQLLPVFGAMLSGPALVGIFMTAAVDGREGLRAPIRRQLRWRVGGRWYAVALLTTPVLLLTVLGTLSLVSPDFLPAVLTADGVASAVGFGLVFGLGAGFLEEIGWTGYALPKLLERHGMLAAGAILGLIWGIWHALADYWGTAAQFGALWPARIILWVAALTAYRMLMVWVYQRANGSLLLAQLMHASFTGSQAVLDPAVGPGRHFVWYGIFTLALWAVVLFVARRTTKPTGCPPDSSSPGGSTSCRAWSRRRGDAWRDHEVSCMQAACRSRRPSPRAVRPISLRPGTGIGPACSRRRAAPIRADR